MEPISASPEVVDRFLERLAAADGAEPLSEHKAMRVHDGDDARTLVLAEGSEIAAVAVAARHGDRWALEVAVAPERRGTPAETAALREAAARLLPDDGTLWVRRREALDVAAAEGWRPVRELQRWERDLPLPSVAPPTGERFRSYRDGDEEAFLAAVAEAFAGHPEAGHLDAEGFAALRRRPWFDPAGLVLAEEDGRLVGFCWTKREGDAGEIYLVGVRSAGRGRGLGRALVVEGARRLAAAGARRLTLWVDEGNLAARRLYAGLGMRPVEAVWELERAQPNR